ncbi:MAG: hypothetical protein J0H06_12595 [Actinobacteria bacterium]|nr:hypothetical protein [Actinomycetota bacterium]OJU84257.1 MAG: hypothetical protein BGO11_21660 [Solirubrobacterales bacterium 70-9]
MIPPETVTAGVRIVRGEEAWQPVLFGGMIPIVGALGVLWLIRWAIKDPPEHNKDVEPEDDAPPPSDPVDDGHEGPLS